MEGCSYIVSLQKKWFPDGQIVVAIDCDGLGGPFADILRSMISDHLNIRILEMHGSSTDKEKVNSDYFNLRAQLSFHAKEQMEKGLISFDDNQYAREEALEEQYFVGLKGKIQIEDKLDLKERLGRSPNRWDARKLGIWGLQYATDIKAKDRYSFAARKKEGLPHSMMSA